MTHAHELHDCVSFAEAIFLTGIYTGLAFGVIVIGLWAWIEKKARV